MRKQNEEEVEELSRDVLEKLLMREMVQSKSFINKISRLFDKRWFTEDSYKIISQICIKSYNKNGPLEITKDLVQSWLTKFNEVNQNKINITRAIQDFNAAITLDIKLPPELLLKKLNRFVRCETLKQSMLDNADDLDHGSSDKIANDCISRLEKVQKILIEDMKPGLVYGKETMDNEEVDNHWAYLTNTDSKISTGWDCIDQITNGGFLKSGKSLYIVMAQANLGKSLFLTNIAYNFLCQGMKVLVFSMEMSEDVYGRRFDALLSDVCIDELQDHIEVVKKRTNKFFTQDHPTAQLIIKEYPPHQVSTNTFKAYIERIYDENGFKPDVIIVDYLNIVAPNGGSGKDDSMFKDGLTVSEELRALSYDTECPVVTAVQTNSEGMDTTAVSMKNISQSRGIAFTGDFIIALVQDEEMQKNGEIDGRILKNRLGRKDGIPLQFHFDDRTLKLEDFPDQGSEISTITDESGNIPLDIMNDIDDLL